MRRATKPHGCGETTRTGPGPGVGSAVWFADGGLLVRARARAAEAAEDVAPGTELGTRQGQLLRGACAAPQQTHCMCSALAEMLSTYCGAYALLSMGCIRQEKVWNGCVLYEMSSEC